MLYCDKCFNLVTAVRCAECNGLVLGKDRLEAGTVLSSGMAFLYDLDSFYRDIWSVLVVRATWSNLSSLRSWYQLMEKWLIMDSV